MAVPPTVTDKQNQIIAGNLSAAEALNILIQFMWQQDVQNMQGAGMNFTVHFVTIGNHVSNGSLGTAVDIGATKPSGAKKILIQALNQAIRYKLDGNNPTSGAGFRLTPEDGEKIIPISDNGSLKIIQETSGAAVEYQWLK